MKGIEKRESEKLKRLSEYLHEQIKGELEVKEQELRKKLQAEFAARTRANLNKQREELSRKKVVLEQEIQQKISSAFSWIVFVYNGSC